jgi:hypothetical protein
VYDFIITVVLSILWYSCALITLRTSMQRRADSRKLNSGDFWKSVTINWERGLEMLTTQLGLCRGMSLSLVH